MADKLDFYNPNYYSNLEVLSASKPEELRDMIRMIDQPVRVINMYFASGRHYAWVVGNFTIKKIKKGE